MLKFSQAQLCSPMVFHPTPSTPLETRSPHGRALVHITSRPSVLAPCHIKMNIFYYLTIHQIACSQFRNKSSRSPTSTSVDRQSARASVHRSITSAVAPLCDNRDIHASARYHAPYPVPVRVMKRLDRTTSPRQRALVKVPQPGAISRRAAIGCAAASTTALSA